MHLLYTESLKKIDFQCDMFIKKKKACMLIIKYTAFCTLVLAKHSQREKRKKEKKIDGCQKGKVKRQNFEIICYGIVYLAEV